MSTIPVIFPARVESQRVYLRSYQKSDCQMYAAASLRNRQHLQRYEADNSMMSIQDESQAEVVISEYATGWTTGNYFMLGVFNKVTDAFVAQVYVGVVNRDLPEYEIGYVADVEHERQRYVTEAVKAVLRTLFGQMHAQRVSLHCRDSNLRSQRVAERCGFQLEGHIRENKPLSDGSFEGDYCYGLLKREFDPAKNL
jgi:RimJ/RimL family protein N-acetyltransferase